MFSHDDRTSVTAGFHGFFFSLSNPRTPMRRTTKEDIALQVTEKVAMIIGLENKTSYSKMSQTKTFSFDVK